MKNSYLFSPKFVIGESLLEIVEQALRKLDIDEFNSDQNG